MGSGWDREITAYLLKGEERIEIEMTTNKFQVPNNKGNYVIVIEFKHPQGSAQYVGNVLIQ